MVRKVRRQNLPQIFNKNIKSPFFFSYMLLGIAVLTLPVIYFLTKSVVDIRQNAQGNPVLTMIANDPILARAVNDRASVTETNLQEYLWYMYIGIIVAFGLMSLAFVYIIIAKNRN